MHITCNYFKGMDYYKKNVTIPQIGHNYTFDYKIT